MRPACLWPRNPPIRYRARIPTAWVELTLREGKNRQVRRMTARVGFPTLRLIRARVGRVSVEDLAPAAWREIDAAAPWRAAERLAPRAPGGRSPAQWVSKNDFTALRQNGGTRPAW